MRRLVVFNNVSVDGYFTDANNEMAFAKGEAADPEFEAFAAENASGDGVLLFGRVTYEMMASFWPTPVAAEMMPQVAAGMNRRNKIVFSNTLHDAGWQNTTLVRGDAVSYLREFKQDPGTDLVVLGSGHLVTQLAEAGLVDEYQFVIHPVALGAGRTLFETVTAPLNLRLLRMRSFRSGKLFITYEGVQRAAADHSVHLV